MSVNVTLGEVKTQEIKPFPKLMKEKDGAIYYFTTEGVGVPFNDSDYKGELTHTQLKSWEMDLFTDYNGPITLQND